MKKFELKYFIFVGLLLIPVLLITAYLVRDMPEDEEINLNQTKMENYTDGKGYQVEEGQEVATFASGCFWCMEAIMQERDGVEEVLSGYAGGEEVKPTYEDVYKQDTGHREAVHVLYDPSVITYDELLDIFWKNIDPTDPDGQFVDRGFSYTTAIFYHDEAQQSAAERSLKDLEDMGVYEKEIVTKIIPFTTFYIAEEYHQDYYKKSSTRYNLYKNASGREDFKKRVWEEILKEESDQ